LKEILLSGNNIVILDLSKNLLGDKGIAILATALAKSKSLTTLLLCSNEVSGQGMSQLFKALIRNESLVEIDIGTEDGI